MKLKIKLKNIPDDFLPTQTDLSDLVVPEVVVVHGESKNGFAIQEDLEDKLETDGSILKE